MATMKHLSFKFSGLNVSHNLAAQQGLAGSLTGAVSSKNVTEECKGTLGSDGNRTFSAKADSVLDCETYKSSRCESRL